VLAILVAGIAVGVPLHREVCDRHFSVRRHSPCGRR
jgi:hypothetical protein